MRRIGAAAVAILAVAGVCIFPVAASAAPLTGTFNIDGTITATLNTITWQNNAGVADMATIAASGLTGSFVGLGNTDVTIRNLTNPPDVVDASGFTPSMFISFNAAPTLQNLLINFIHLGTASAAQCAATPPLAGQTCTPPVPGGSPFTLTNLGTPGSTPTGSSVSFSFSGVTSDDLSTWNGNFTSQFNVPYQTVLADLAAAGSVTNSYSATFSVTPVPEPGTYLLLAAASLLLVGIRRRKLA